MPPAETAELSGGVAAFVVNGEDVAVKAGFLAKCALSVDALSRYDTFTDSSPPPVSVSF